MPYSPNHPDFPSLAQFRQLFPRVLVLFLEFSDFLLIPNSTISTRQPLKTILPGLWSETAIGFT